MAGSLCAYLLPVLLRLGKVLHQLLNLLFELSSKSVHAWRRLHHILLETLVLLDDLQRRHHIAGGSVSEPRTIVQGTYRLICELSSAYCLLNPSWARFAAFQKSPTELQYSEAAHRTYAHPLSVTLYALVTSLEMSFA